MKPPLKGEGNRRQTVEGFCEIFCFMYQISQKHPSVTCGDSSPKGEPIIHKREAYKKIPAIFSPSTPAKCNALHDF